MTLHAFVDESVRSRYILCAAVVPTANLNEIRRLARELCMPGQRRWHFKSESDRRRRLILDALVRRSDVRVALYMGKGKRPRVRAECLVTLVTDLIDQGGSQLVIESQDGQDRLDRQCLLETLHKAGANLRYRHVRPHEEPGLWLPDAFAWAYGTGGEWRRRIAPSIDRIRDLGDLR
ncbi:hypothetical protein [Actinoallomurus rhizosphaericola]|uniref:hypothetical protein n=1 Tax=Actinoallomurus rhizosphaericola TaxID=2952536 RepID=UPI00209388C8|nr:hypothetical protein [Actinoallomurus rhizosphaericola]MCO5994913.1 hypothetical protein [Actinoallomurus rhizosphaericola]